MKWGKWHNTALLEVFGILAMSFAWRHQCGHLPCTNVSPVFDSHWFIRQRAITYLLKGAFPRSDCRLSSMDIRRFLSTMTFWDSLQYVRITRCLPYTKSNSAEEISCDTYHGKNLEVHHIAPFEMYEWVIRYLQKKCRAQKVTSSLIIFFIHK